MISAILLNFFNFVWASFTVVMLAEIGCQGPFPCVLEQWTVAGICRTVRNISGARERDSHTSGGSLSGTVVLAIAIEQALRISDKQRSLRSRRGPSEIGAWGDADRRPWSRYL